MAKDRRALQRVIKDCLQGIGTHLPHISDIGEVPAQSLKDAISLSLITLLLSGKRHRSISAALLPDYRAALFLRRCDFSIRPPLFTIKIIYLILCCIMAIKLNLEVQCKVYTV